MAIGEKISNWRDRTTPQTPEGFARRRKLVAVLGISALTAVSLLSLNSLRSDGNNNPMHFSDDLQLCEGTLNIAEGTNIRPDPRVTDMNEIGSGFTAAEKEAVVGLESGDWFSVSGYQGDSNGKWVGVPIDTLKESELDVVSWSPLKKDGDGVVWINTGNTRTSLELSSDCSN